MPVAYEAVSDDESDVDGSASVTPSPNIECGCNQSSLRKFDKSELEAQRLNLSEMEKSEEDLLIIGVSLSVHEEKIQGKHAEEKGSTS